MHNSIPILNTEQMREVDRLMVEAFGIQLTQMMENAGRGFAALARDRFLGGDTRGSHVLVLAGSGGNGGGGLVAGRRLHSWGAEVTVFLSRKPEDMDGVPAQQLSVLQALEGIQIVSPMADQNFPRVDLILDALIGYSLKGAPRGAAARLIQRAVDHEAPILSLDVPTGIDAGTGKVHSPHIKADATLTLALPKAGLFMEETRPHVGELYLADIGVPLELYQGMGISVGPLFAEGDLIRLY
jgi:NAD(P)H-hydrate epimerase